MAVLLLLYTYSERTVIEDNISDGTAAGSSVNPDDQRGGASAVLSFDVPVHMCIYYVLYASFDVHIYICIYVPFNMSYIYIYIYVYIQLYANKHSLQILTIDNALRTR